jgi:hypothetical protein
VKSVSFIAHGWNSNNTSRPRILTKRYDGAINRLNIFYRMKMGFNFLTSRNMQEANSEKKGDHPG